MGIVGLQKYLKDSKLLKEIDPKNLNAFFLDIGDEEQKRIAKSTIYCNVAGWLSTWIDDDGKEFERLKEAVQDYRSILKKIGFERTKFFVDGMGREKKGREESKMANERNFFSNVSSIPYLKNQRFRSIEFFLLQDFRENRKNTTFQSALLEADDEVVFQASKNEDAVGYVASDADALFFFDSEFPKACMKDLVVFIFEPPSYRKKEWKVKWVKRSEFLQRLYRISTPIPIPLASLPFLASLLWNDFVSKEDAKEVSQQINCGQKIQTCQYWKQGQCKQGLFCPFVHGKVELVAKKFLTFIRNCTNNSNHEIFHNIQKTFESSLPRTFWNSVKIYSLQDRREEDEKLEKYVDKFMKFQIPEKAMRFIQAQVPIKENQSDREKVSNDNNQMNEKDQIILEITEQKLETLCIMKPVESMETLLQHLHLPADTIDKEMPFFSICLHLCKEGQYEDIPHGSDFITKLEQYKKDHKEGKKEPMRGTRSDYKLVFSWRYLLAEIYQLAKFLELEWELKKEETINFSVEESYAMLLEKSMNCTERVKRMEERKLLLDDYEKTKKEDELYFKEQMELFLKTHKETHARNLEEKKRISRMLTDKEKFEEALFKRRQEQHEILKKEREQRLSDNNNEDVWFTQVKGKRKQK